MTSYSNTSRESLRALERIQKPIKRSHLARLVDQMCEDHLPLAGARLVLSKLKVVR